MGRIKYQEDEDGEGDEELRRDAMKLNDYEKRVIRLNKHVKNPLLLYRDFAKILEITFADLDKCIDISKANPKDQIWKRLVVRTAFSVIDSVCYKLKEFVYCSAKHCGYNLSQEEEFFLLGVKKDKQGIPNNYRYPLEENIEKTIDISEKFYGLIFTVQSAREWKLFKKAIKVRNRITHPKHSNDLSISQEEDNMASDAFSWFMKRIFEIHVASSGIDKVKWKKIEARGRVAPSA